MLDHKTVNVFYVRMYRYISHKDKNKSFAVKKIFF